MHNKAESSAPKHQGTTRIPQLSDRLKVVYQLILPNQPLWDIGCDHGYLGLYAYRNRLCTEVYLVDRSKQALQNTRRRIAHWFPEEPSGRLHVWDRDATRQFLPINQGTVVMAGLGTKTIVQMIMKLFPSLCLEGYG